MLWQAAGNRAGSRGWHALTTPGSPGSPPIGPASPEGPDSRNHPSAAQGGPPHGTNAMLHAMAKDCGLPRVGKHRAISPHRVLAL